MITGHFERRIDELRTSIRRNTELMKEKSQEGTRLKEEAEKLRGQADPSSRDIKGATKRKYDVYLAENKILEAQRNTREVEDIKKLVFNSAVQCSVTFYTKIST